MANIPTNTMENILQTFQNAQQQQTQMQPTSDPQSPYSLEEYAKAKGYQDVKYDQKTGRYSINGQQLSQNMLTGLNQQQNQLYGTEKQYAKLLNQFAISSGEGQYVSPYSTEMEKLYQELESYTPYETPEETQQYLANLLQSASQPFTYDPTQDEALQAAMTSVAQEGFATAASKGTLYSGGTVSNIARAQGALIPQYESKAYSRYADERNREFQMASTIMEWDQMQADRHTDQLRLIQTKFEYMMNLDQNEFQKFQALLEQRNFEKQLEIDRAALDLAQKQQRIDAQWARVNQMGYADNQAAIVLGIKPGTKAQWVTQLEIEKRNQMDLLKKEYENQKKLQQAQAKIDKDLANYKNKLDQATALKVAKKQYEYDVKLANKQQALAKGNQSFSGGVMASAQSLMGLKYVWGGTSTTKGMDCSGFSQWVMKQNGININRVAADQAKQGTLVTNSTSGWNKLQKGDLLFWDTIDGNGKTVDHVGIYAGNGQMIHASSGQGKVVTANINTSYWKSRFTTAKRFSGGAGSSSGSYTTSSSSKKSTTTPLLVSGSKGSYVTKAQKSLKALGYYNSKIDGDFGKNTKAAVIAFQKKNGLKADGKIGTNTWAKLNGSAIPNDSTTWNTAQYYAYLARGGK